MAGKGIGVLHHIGSGITSNFTTMAYIPTLFRGSATGIGGGSPEIANTMQLTPIMGGNTISAISLVNNTNNSGQKVRLGLYNSGSDGLPTTLVEEFGELTLGNGFGLASTFTLSVPRAMDADKLYWLALGWNSTSTLYRYVSGVALNTIGSGDYVTKNQIRAIRISFTYSAGFTATFPLASATLDGTSQVIVALVRYSA